MLEEQWPMSAELNLRRLGVKIGIRTMDRQIQNLLRNFYVLSSFITIYVWIWIYFEPVKWVYVVEHMGVVSKRGEIEWIRNMITHWTDDVDIKIINQ